MPVYYKIEGQDYKLAIKDNGWQPSDPKAVVDWFNKHKNKFGQLIRTVMYQKGWCDNLRDKMPSGLAMTILSTNANRRLFITTGTISIYATRFKKSKRHSIGTFPVLYLQYLMTTFLPIMMSQEESVSRMR